MGLLKTLFYILLFYYAFKFISKLLAPFLLKKMANSMRNKASGQYNNKQNHSSIKEGETVIDKAPKNNNSSNNSVGEYVDYEEID